MAKWLLVNTAVLAATSCSVLGLSVVRPFSAQGAWSLNASFQAWGNLPPCLPGAATETDRTLELYFLGPASAHPFASSLPYDSSSSSSWPELESLAAWQHCFADVKLTSTPGAAPLFERVAAPGELLYYMDAGVVPLQEGWLEALEAEAVRAAPFSVLGGKHVYASTWIANDAERSRLDLNAVYNTSSRLVQLAAMTLDRREADVVMAQLQHKFGSTFLEAYVATPAAAYFADAVVTTGNAAYKAASVARGGLAAAAGSVTLFVRGLGIETDPPTVDGASAVVAAAEDDTACTVDLGLVTTQYFAFAAAAGLRPAEVPFDSASNTPLAFFTQTADRYTYNDRRAVYDARHVAEWCRSTTTVDATSYFRHIANVTPATLAVDSEAASLPAWFSPAKPLAPCRLAEDPNACPCTWPFEWAGKTYRHGECALGGGPASLWCAAGNATLRPDFQWSECTPHVLLAAAEVDSLNDASEAVRNETVLRLYCPSQLPSTLIFLGIFLAVALIVIAWASSDKVEPLSEKPVSEFYF